MPEGILCDTHYQNDIAQVPDDGNAFAEWLKSKGIFLSLR